jgi:hypothetical protein
LPARDTREGKKLKGLILLIGFPNNKYLPNTKNYLRCLVLGEGGI